MRRSGATLLEVLVAIFVMGIGLLALLTLFPLGALRMAKAIQDERCAQTGATARCVFPMKNVPGDPNLAAPFTNPLNPKVAGIVDSGPDTPSYPVLVDPTGYRTAFGTSYQSLVGGNSLIGRASVAFVNNQQDAFNWFTLLDDIDFESTVGGGFGPTGAPRLLVAPPPSRFFRDIRYSFAYMCQRPRQADPMVVDTAVVVYNKRPLSGVGNQSLPEYVYPTVAAVSTTTFFPQPDNIVVPPAAANTIRIAYGPNVPPPVRTGDWILDATPVPNGAGNIVTAHAYFYRIVAVNDLGAGVTEVEVETPLRGFTTTTNGTAIVLDGVAEVFMREPPRVP